MTIASIDEITDLAALRPAVCIVGGGAAGITLACELDGAGFEVVLLEAGGLKVDAATAQRYYEGESLSPLHPQAHEFRRIGLGGTTSIWGGRCVPFDPIDFEVRDWVPESGWPIGYDEVAPHYPKAMAYCEAGRFEFGTAAALHRAAPTIPGLEASGAVLADRIERYSLPTNFGVSHRAQLQRSTNVRVLLDVRVVALHRAGQGDAIESVELVDRAGKRQRLQAQRFVLAMGGVETTRLLLAGDEGRGLGNQGDALGRYYACHIEKPFAKVFGNGVRLPFDFERTVDGVYARRKLQFAAGAQREHRLLNAAFRLHFPAYSDASHRSAAMSAIYLAKSTVIAEYRAILAHGNDGAVMSPAAEHLRNVVLGAPQLFKFAYDWLFRRVLAHRKLPYTLIQNADGSYPLEFNSEQIPLPSSRIALAGARDEHGLPRVRIDWRVCDEDIAANQRAFRLLREEINATPTCRMEFDDERLDAALRSAVAIGGHHIGSTRMAASANRGVVDADCTVYGARNLSIASASVFPTSSHANPTLTIVALTLRLAALLRRQLAAG